MITNRESLATFAWFLKSYTPMRICLPIIFTALVSASVSCNRAELAEFQIENPSAAQLMLSSDAGFDGTESTPMHEGFYDAANALAEYRSDQPAMKTLAFEGKEGTAVVRMATDRRFGHTVLCDTVSLNGGSGSYRLRNMVPGQNYWYKVEDGSGTLVSGAFIAAGQLRMIAIDDGFNIRDLGGWKGLGGHRLRYGSIYRGGSLGGTDQYGGTDTTLSEDSRKELARIGIKAQLDLRAGTNEGRYRFEDSFHSYSRDGATVPGADFNDTQTDDGAYNQDASVVSDLAWIIYELKQGRPVYFNCRQGADRTGTIAFVIEGLTGCFQAANEKGANQMAIDYELTSFSRAELVDNMARANSGRRGAHEAYRSRSKLFRQIMDLCTEDVDFAYTFNADDLCTEENMLAIHERCYYYLNRYWSLHTPDGGQDAKNAAVCIDDDDLDWFICHMLDMSPKEYARYKPSWAFSWDDQAGAELCGTAGSCGQNGVYDLKRVGEANTRVVKYAERATTR